MCRRCRSPLFGGEAQARRSFASPVRTSRRWILNAVLVSIILAIVLLFAVYFFTIIFDLQGTELVKRGWADFAPEQLYRIGWKWGTSLFIGLPLVWWFFYSRRDKYDL
jgi:hypothetical protein